MNPSITTILKSISFAPEDISFINQNPDEKILLFLRQHKIVLVPHFFWAIVLALIPPIITVLVRVAKSNNLDLSFGFPPLIWMALMVLWYFYIFAYLYQVSLGWFFNVYVMTTQRLIDFNFEGLLSHGADETSLSSIETAESAVGGLWGTVFNMGVITIRTAADINNFKLDNIPNPDKVRDYIMDYVANKHIPH